MIITSQAAAAAGWCVTAIEQIEARTGTGGNAALQLTESQRALVAAEAIRRVTNMERR